MNLNIYPMLHTNTGFQTPMCVKYKCTFYLETDRKYRRNHNSSVKGKYKLILGENILNFASTTCTLCIILINVYI